MKIKKHTHQGLKPTLLGINMKPKKTFLGKVLLLCTAALVPLSLGQTAHAQSAPPLATCSNPPGLLDIRFDSIINDTGAGSGRTWTYPNAMNYLGEDINIEATLVSITGTPDLESNDATGSGAKTTLDSIPKASSVMETEAEIEWRFVRASDNSPINISTEVEFGDLDSQSIRLESLFVERADYDGYSVTSGSTIVPSSNGTTDRFDGSIQGSSLPSMAVKFTLLNRNSFTWRQKVTRPNGNSSSGRAGFTAIGSGFKVDNCPRNDFSDAAITDEAQHTAFAEFTLGSAITAEASAQTATNADGDTSDDGVMLPVLNLGGTGTIDVVVNEPTAGNGYLQAWIDWNGDGNFSGVGEQIAVDLQDSDGDTSIAIPVSVPANATTNQTYARFRWSSEAGLDDSTSAPNGEVEDYVLTLAPAAPLPLPLELPPNVCAIEPATQFWERRAEWSSNGSDPFQPDTADSSVFSRVEPFVAGPGLTNINPGSSQILISGADQATFLDAYGAGDFIDYTVETIAGLPNTWVLSGSSENGGRNGNPFKIAMLMSNDNFATATRIFTDVDVDGQGFDWITNGFSQQYLEAGTEYIFRVVFYGMANPGQEIAQDDFALSADQCADQGDANFPNSSANGGVHTLPSIRNHYIGAVSPDAEFFVNADDNTAGDAGAGEEAVTFPTFNAGATATVNIPVTGSGGLLNAWIDWNQNEQFEASERVATDDVIPGGGASGTIPLSVVVPAGATVGDSWARLRWSPNSISDPTGDVAEGELEDHLVTVAAVTADLSITKTNTAGVNGEVDQADDTLTSGDTTTYTLVVTNNGPDTVTGAVVTDVIGNGLTCAPTNVVSISGDGVPAGSFTVADLTGAGITLETLADGESATFTYTCEVN